MAAGIPGARFVPLGSPDQLMLEHEPAFARLLAEFHTFVAPSAAP
jgi:hypothetical protein